MKMSAFFRSQKCDLRLLLVSRSNWSKFQNSENRLKINKITRASLCNNKYCNIDALITRKLLVEISQF